MSWRWHEAVFANEETAAAALNSVQLAVIAASVATVMATAAALAMVRMKVRQKAAAYAILNFPLMVPEIVTDIASLILFSSVGLGLGLGFGLLVIAHTIFCILFAYLPIAAFALDEASASLPGHVLVSPTHGAVRSASTGSLPVSACHRASATST